MNKLKLATVNNVSIIGLEADKNMLVPIKPICEALGIATQSQIEKIKVDEKLSSVATLSIATGGDGKQYKMFCIPFKYVFGWLFTINPKNVNPNAKEAILNYQMECYDVLYEHFTDAQTFLSEKQKVIDSKTTLLSKQKSNFNQAQHLMRKTEKELKDVLKLTIEDWKANSRQLGLPFQDEEDHDDQSF